MRENVLGKVDGIAIGAAHAHRRVRRKLLDLVEVGLVEKNRARIGLIRRENDCKDE
jgi:hypothetical protein